MDQPLSIPRTAVRVKTIRRGDRIQTPDGVQIARYIYRSENAAGCLVHLVGTANGQEYPWEEVELA